MGMARKAKAASPGEKSGAKDLGLRAVSVGTGLDARASMPAADYCKDPYADHGVNAGGYSRPRLRGLRGPGGVLPPDPFAPSCPSGLGSGGGLGPWQPGKRATSQATTSPAWTLWRQRSEYSIFLPSRRKRQQSQPCYCLPIAPIFLGLFPWLLLILWVSKRPALMFLSNVVPSVTLCVMETYFIVF